MYHSGIALPCGEPTIIPDTDDIRVHRNPRVAPREEPYGSARARILNRAGYVAAEREIGRWPGHAETPLHRLPRLAARLGLAAIHHKDEGGRFGLGSFKALGGAYAVFRLLKHTIESRSRGQEVGARSGAQGVGARSGAQGVGARSGAQGVGARSGAQGVGTRSGARGVDSRQLIDGRWRDVSQTVTVTCATDGNHGRSVAWGARLFGCRCVIYVHQAVSEARCAAIRQYGADVIRVPGNYDDSVRHAADEARKHGWTVVSDTAYEGYREIPIDVMHGYGVMSCEIVRAMADEPPTHVFVQAGVGALAASVCAVFWLEWKAHRPRLVIVEPIGAACHFESGLAGRPVAVTGSLHTVMAGLACGEVSPLAWEIVNAGASAYVAVADRFALAAMRILATPASGDPTIVAGETGAAGLAALLAAEGNDTLRRALELDARSRVLLIGSEGDTDPELYRRIVTNASAAPT